MPRDEVVAFLHQLPVGAIWGVGDRTEEHLHRLGLRTVADLAHTPVETLQRALGDSAGRGLHDLAWGRDPRAVVPERREKSIGADETFAHDIDDPVRIHRELLRLSDRTAARARSAGMTGRTVSIKVRFADFTTITRAKTLRHHTDVSREIFDTARELYDRLGLQRARIRLVGVRLEGLVPTARGAHPGTPGRARARLARRGPGGRPGQRSLRRRLRAAREPHARPTLGFPTRPSRIILRETVRVGPSRLRLRVRRDRTGRCHVALSEHEEALLQQMEEALYAEDPRFASRIEKTKSRGVGRGRVVIGVVAAVAGLALVVVSAMSSLIWLGAIGFAIMVAGIVYAITPSKTKLAVVDSDGTPKPRVGRPSAGRRPSRAPSWSAWRSAGRSAAATSGDEPEVR